MKTSFEDTLIQLRGNDLSGKTLNLEYTRISAADAKELSEALKINTSLTKLNFFYNRIGDVGEKELSEALKINTSLTKLNLKGNNLGAIGTKYLSEALKINTSLTKLNLVYSSGISAVGAKELSEALKINTSLTKLNLGCNRISDVGAKELSEAFKINTSLTKLNLGCNRISDVGAKELSEAFKINTSLTKLSLFHNGIGDVGAKELSEALKINTSLTKLNLGCNRISDVGAKELSEALKINTSLTKLNLGCNFIGAVGAKELSEALKINTSLTKLSLKYNCMDATDVAYLIEALQSNYTLLELEGIANDNTKKHLARNNVIAECLLSLSDLISASDLAVLVAKLETLLPSLPSLPEDSYPAEVYRLLTALGHQRSWGEETQYDALRSLLPVFKHPKIQQLADKALGLLLVGELNSLLALHHLEQTGMLLSLYCLKHHSHEPEIKPFIYITLFKLTQGNQPYTFEKKQGFEEKTRLLTPYDFLTLLNEALAHCNKEAQGNEVQLLSDLIKAKLCHSFSLASACLSPSFLTAFKAHYPNAECFTTLDHCLLTAAYQKSAYFIDITTALNPLVTQDQVADFTLQLDYHNTNNIKQFVASLKNTLDNALPVELSDNKEANSTSFPTSFFSFFQIFKRKSQTRPQHKLENGFCPGQAHIKK